MPEDIPLTAHKTSLRDDPSETPSTLDELAALEYRLRFQENFYPRELLNQIGCSTRGSARRGRARKFKAAILLINAPELPDYAEQTDAEELCSFINGAMDWILPVLRENGGFVQELQTDRMVLNFGDEPAAALATALELRETLQELDRLRHASMLPGLQVHMALHHGWMVAGIAQALSGLQPFVISKMMEEAMQLLHSRCARPGVIFASANFFDACPLACREQFTEESCDAPHYTIYRQELPQLPE